MAVSFRKESLFSKGIVYGEFFNIEDDSLLGYSQYISNFGVAGSMNNGEVAAGPGAQLVMMIPDTARLNITAQTADTDINNLALPVGGTVSGNGVIETIGGFASSGTVLTVPNAVAPLGGQNGAICYILTSTGNDKALVEQNSGTAYPVAVDGTVTGFEAVANATYCVKYFVENSSAEMLTIPALFNPKVVRAHFAVNLYAKKGGSSVLESSLVGIRHYYFPYYSFTATINETASQTETGTIDLSGTCLSYEDAINSANCENIGSQLYGWIVDEMLGENSSTSRIEGIYFIGMGAGISVVRGTTYTLPIKYAVNGVLTNISDMSQIEFESSDTTKATVSGNVLTAVAAGTTTITASVTNSSTGVEYTDSIDVTVTAS